MKSMKLKNYVLAAISMVCSMALLAGCSYDAAALSTAADDLHKFALEFNKAHHDDTDEEFFAALGQEFTDKYVNEAVEYSAAVVSDYANKALDDATDYATGLVDTYGEDVVNYGNQAAQAGIEFGQAFVKEDGSIDMDKVNNYGEQLLTYGNAAAIEYGNMANDYGNAVLDTYGESIDAYTGIVDAYGDALLNDNKDGFDLSKAVDIIKANGVDTDSVKATANNLLQQVGDTNDSDYYIGVANSYINQYSGGLISSYNNTMNYLKAFNTKSDEPKEISKKKPAPTAAAKAIMKDSSELIDSYRSSVVNDINSKFDSGYYSSIATELINGATSDSAYYINMTNQLIGENGNGFDASYYNNVEADVIDQINQAFANGSIDFTFNISF